MSQFPKKFDPNRAWVNLLKNKINVSLNINTDHGDAMTNIQLHYPDEDHPIIKRLRERNVPTPLEVISSDVITKRINPHLLKYGYEFDQVIIEGQSYWGLISLSGLSSLSIIYDQFGRAFEAALEMIASEVPEALHE